MSMSQKCAWAQLGIFGALVIAWLVLFIDNGSIFYWQDNTFKMTFYWLCAAAFAALVIMNISTGILKSRRKEVTDERDRAIFRKASLWATGVSYTVVAALLLALAITYMNGNSETIPVYFPLLIVIVGGVTLLLTQAITALLLYGRKVNYGES
jgi:cytochrome bd-type quinol oxidase subunit 2